MKHLALRQLERAINQVLRLDPDTIDKLQALQGKVMAVEITDIARQVYIQPDANGIRLLAAYNEPADTTLRGTLAGFLKLGRSIKEAKGLTNNAVTITGDFAFGQKMQHIFQSLDIDWEEQLSHYIGDIAAHQLGRAARWTRRGFNQATQSLKRNLVEYAQEDKQLYPSSLELNDFYADVTELRDALARLDARFKRYQKNHPL